jgi:hypothetical protein
VYDFPLPPGALPPYLRTQRSIAIPPPIHSPTHVYCHVVRLLVSMPHLYSATLRTRRAVSGITIVAAVSVHLSLQRSCISVLALLISASSQHYILISYTGEVWPCNSPFCAKSPAHVHKTSRCECTTVCMCPAFTGPLANNSPGIHSE